MESKSIKVDFYDGAYGSTLRIFTNTIDNLKKVYNIFLQLKQGKISIYSISSINNIEIDGLSDLVLKLDTNKDDWETELKIDNPGTEKVVFTWSLSKEEIEDCICLIKSLIENYGGSKHQYLMDNEDLLVIVIY